MPTIRHVLTLAAFLSALFLSAATAYAQTAVNYHFLEVSDAKGQPVADAKVESIGWSPISATQTDARGHADAPIYYGDYNTQLVKVSKPGYLPYEVAEIFDRIGYRELVDNEIPGYDQKTPIKIVLVKIPVNAAEREAVEAERLRRELLQAVKAGDVAAAGNLLRARVSPDAANFDGIPAVLFAAVKGNGEMVKGLLAAGADVRNKSRPGRKALLYYIRSVEPKVIDLETVRRLIEAGADVNAADKYGETVLVRAERFENPELIKLLGKAGAR